MKIIKNLKKLTYWPFQKASILYLTISIFGTYPTYSQSAQPVLQYTVSIPEPASNNYEVVLKCKNWHKDTLELKMPNWMPGYYQKIDYAKSLENLNATDTYGKKLTIIQKNKNTWQIVGSKNTTSQISYRIHTNKQFVANSYVDSSRAYIIPENTFLYIPNYLQIPVTVEVIQNPKWSKIATGLLPLKGKVYEFSAPNFDILYDCPILVGNLKELPSFTVKGIEHRFLGFDIGEFDQQIFMGHLKKIVEAASEIIGDIPYKQYTFIGIGPGRGGIEHLNNTTISFKGDELNNPEVMNRTLNFITHEYFHHYNVKRIRPYELGPFDYENGNRTNLLWLSEGLTVYYEYLIMKRAGLANEHTLFEDFEANLNAVENNPGRHFQSLQQASYSTWSDGPFGNQGKEQGKSISYYDKGPLVGLLLDFEIRNTTKNQKSLDDVMRYLYWKYYKKENRGFTEAELLAACESVAEKAMSDIFEYIYTTKDLDYNKYLAYAGLKVNASPATKPEKVNLKISKLENVNGLQTEIYKTWAKE